MNTLYSTYINRLSVSLLVLTICTLPTLQAQNTDLPNPTPNIQTAPAGTWVIAMDNALQANPGYFNVKAYGLVVKILNAERPVRWVIQSGKAKDGVDFSAMATRVFPTTAAPAMLNFKAGPFLVYPQDTAGLTALVQAFNNAQSSNSKVNVYQLTGPTQVDVRYVLTQKPRGAVLNDGNNAKIHASYYIRAGVDSPMNWHVTNASNLAGQCYTFASEPHSNVVGPTIDSIRAYILGGGNFLAQCQAVGTFENAASGRFHTTNGITTTNQATTPNYAYPNADLSFSQYEGRFDPMMVGGAQRNWRKSTGSSFINDHHKHQSGALPSDTTVIGQSVAKLSTGRGHLVFYTGGHDYSKNNSIDQVNGMRAFFNAFLTPSGLTQCDFLTSTADIAVQKTVNDANLCIGDTTSFLITVRNMGSTAAAPASVTVQDVFPVAGLSVSSFSTSTGSFSPATGTWNVGTVLPGASETLFINVTAINAGLFVNTAYADNYPGDGNAANDTSNVSVQVFAPEVVTLPAVTACGSYTLPWGTVVTNSGNYSNTIPSVNGCDSTQTVNVTITAGSPEVCNGLDDDCNGSVDDGLTYITYFNDNDNDSYGAGTGTSFCSNPGSGYSINSDDCDDSNIAINPAANEICNGLDDDCDGQIDEETGEPLGTITGNGVACVPLAAGTATFTVPPAAGVSNYFWTLPPGATIVSGQNTNSITIGWSTTVMHNTGIIGTLSVTGAYVCGTSEPSSIQLDLNFTVPVRPPSPSGPSRLCPGDVATYSISPVFRTRSYFWTTPTGMVITSGQGTNIIQVAVNNTYTGGDLTVEALNSCGSGPVRIKNLGLALALTPDPISGPSTGVCGAAGVVYSTAGSANATSYLWTVPTGVTIKAGQGTNSITVDISGSFGNGSVAVQGVNGCGAGATRNLSIQGKPFISGSISGSQSVCPGAVGVPYSIVTVSGATAYVWTPPGGSLVSSGQGTKNVLINYGSTEATNQSMAVRASNSCGVSNAKTLGGITISSTFCGTRLSDTDPEIGIGFGLRPNPVRDLVLLDIRLQEATILTLRIADITGRLVYTERVELQAGVHTLQRDFYDLPSGIYAITLDSPGGNARQMMLVE